jgi:hypothetical protein
MSTITTIKKNWVSLNCQKCGNSYSVVPCRVKKSKFCSRICQVSGQVWTQERKDKIGKATSGSRPSIKGENHYFWKGGSWNYIKTLVRLRDNDVCQCTGICQWHLGEKCGFKDSYIMHVDHIKPKKLFPDLKLSMDNLIVVCPNCHQMKTNTERRNKIFTK